MNFDNVSFRPTTQQKEFLDKLWNYYGTPGMTDLMRMILDECIKQDIGNVGFGNASTMRNTIKTGDRNLKPSFVYKLESSAADNIYVVDHRTRANNLEYEISRLAVENRDYGVWLHNLLLAHNKLQDENEFLRGQVNYHESINQSMRDQIMYNMMNTKKDRDMANMWSDAIKKTSSLKDDIDNANFL